MNYKITPQQIKEMKMFHKLGWTNKKISEKYNVSAASVSFKIRNIKNRSRKRDGIGDNPEEIPLFIRQNLAKREEEKKPKECKGEKEWKWRFTRFCSFSCFKKYGIEKFFGCHESVHLAVFIGSPSFYPIR